MPSGAGAAAGAGATVVGAESGSTVVWAAARGGSSVVGRSRRREVIAAERGAGAGTGAPFAGIKTVASPSASMLGTPPMSCVLLGSRVSMAASRVA